MGLVCLLIHFVSYSAISAKLCYIQDSSNPVFDCYRWFERTLAGLRSLTTKYQLATTPARQILCEQMTRNLRLISSLSKHVKKLNPNQAEIKDNVNPQPDVLGTELNSATISEPDLRD